MRRIVDISPPISPRIGVWPGDSPYRRVVKRAIAQGANIDLSELRTTVHLGAHADAPSHYAAGAPGIGEIGLEPYLGPCELLRVAVGRGERVTPGALPRGWEPRAPRVLVQTGSFPDPERWNLDFASLSPELVDWLADRGVLLVGIDTPSVDPFDDRELRAHQALARRGLRNLEGLRLDGVPEGLWELAALPLRLLGADASPVRAVLFRDP